MSGITSAAVALPPRNAWRSTRITFAPASAAPMAAPSPAGPPPTTSTSHSAATVAVRGARVMVVGSRGRSSGGIASASRCASGLHLPTRPVVLQDLEGDLVGAPGARLDLGHRLLEPGLQVAPQVPPAIDVGDELARVDLLERRHGDLEILEEARHLARVRPGHETQHTRAARRLEAGAYAD